MRRDVLIAAGVLVPFSVLVALGWLYAWPKTPTVDPGAIAMQPAVVDVPDAGAPRLTERPQQTVDAGLPPAVPETAAHPALTAELRARVAQCAADQERAPRELRVRFTPERDGGFSALRVDTQEPWLEACVIDTFTETGWRPSPSGTESFGPQDHTFTFR